MEMEEDLNKEESESVDDVVEDLAEYFRQVSRGRIVELPRWAR